MTDLHAQIDVLEGDLPESLAGAAAGLSKRTFAVLRLTRNDGTIGVGEASPLPGYSPDSIAEASDELQRLADQPVHADPLASPHALLEETFATHSLRHPSSRFALETAMLDWLGHTRGAPVHQILAGDVERLPIPIADLVLEANPGAWPARADELLGDGATHLKLKIGSDLDAEVAALEVIRRAHPALPLRLDGNRRIPIEALQRHVHSLEALELELIEEPVAPEEWPTALSLPLPFALDESLRDATLSRALLESGKIRAVVIKPMVLGGLRASLEVAERAAAHGAKYLVSHTFDGPIARAVTAELALALQTELAAGLGWHPALALWPPHHIAAIRDRQIVPHGVPGLGLELEEDPMVELSVLAAAKEASDADCLVIDGRVWSFADVAMRVRVAIASLRARAVEPGHRVALTPNGDVDSVLWLYALFELGCPAVLLHPRLTDRERAVVLGEAQPSHVITERVPDNTVTDEASTPRPISADETLAIAYTSGSRGAPRGAVLSRRAFIASEAAHAANLGWIPEDRWLLCMPPAHVGGLSILTRCLIARRCVVLSPGAFDPGEVTRVMARDQVTLLSVVPTMLRRLLTAVDPAWMPNPDLRAVLVGGAPFPDALRELAVTRGVPALATYGCTEACSQIATQTPEQTGRPGSGAPLAGVEARIVAGEIVVRGDVLMDRYLVEDRNDTVWDSDRWLRTGDFGSFLPDGQLLVRGRVDDIIVTGGENVAPQEVEAWLETVPGIASACVFSVPHDEWGEEVVAALVTDSTRYSPNTLRERLANELAAHKRPKRICVLGSLPLNRSGKVDRAVVASDCLGRLRPI